MHNKLALKIKGHFKRKYAWWLVSIWAFLFVVFIVSFSLLPVSDKCAPLTLDKMRIYNQNRDHFALWERGKAIEFGLTQTTTIINYLFVAAAALLGFVVKLMIDPLLSTESRIVAQQPEATLLKNVAIGCFFSILYGFSGYTYIAKIPTAEDFGPFEELGVGAALQQISFLLAVILLVVAASMMLNKANRAKESGQ